MSYIEVKYNLLSVWQAQLAQGESVAAFNMAFGIEQDANAVVRNIGYIAADRRTAFIVQRGDTNVLFVPEPGTIAGTTLKVADRRREIELIKGDASGAILSF